MLGESFKVFSGVRQGGILSPYLFALYINDLIDDVKKSSYGIHIGSVFIGCILYADDILLLSGSCTGLQHMVDICFNSSKCYCITFGGFCSTSTPVRLNNVELKRVPKLKYLGCYCCERSCIIDFCYNINKFYGSINNIMSVTGYNKNEMASLQYFIWLDLIVCLLLCMAVKHGVWIVMITIV